MPARRCPHAPKTWELCKDGMYCPACNEGVCENCARLWEPTGFALPEAEGFAFAPQCPCDDDHALSIVQLRRQA